MPKLGVDVSPRPHAHRRAWVDVRISASEKDLPVICIIHWCKFFNLVILFFRIGLCGAWSFDAESKICYLHSVNSCCNQINKSIKAETFISGFVCPFCWSTKNDCPCPEQELRTGIETQFASAGSLVQHGSATVKVFQIKNKTKTLVDYFGHLPRNWTPFRLNLKFLYKL